MELGYSLLDIGYCFPSIPSKICLVLANSPSTIEFTLVQEYIIGAFFKKQGEGLSMHIQEFIARCDAAKKRYHLIGSETTGVIVTLDMEGRWFAIMNGEIINRVNSEAIKGISARDEYLNPGGDGLWPAPEGTTLGYEYSTGKWRVPPGLTGAKYRLIAKEPDSAFIEAEVDLINSQGLGIPTIFSRKITVSAGKGTLTVKAEDAIEYIGGREFSKNECLLAPWSLCQFDSGEGCEVVFPEVPAEAIRDLYDPSGSQRCCKNGFWHTMTAGGPRYQIGMDNRVAWIEYRRPDGLKVKRSAMPLVEGTSYIDIVDAPPDQAPGDWGIKLSVYSDPSCFMEIESAGGCPERIVPGTKMYLESETVFTRK